MLDGGTRVVRRLPIAYRGVWPDQRRTYRTYSFVQLFQSEEQLLAGEKADVDPVAFNGKVVIVGARGRRALRQKAVPFAQKISGPRSTPTSWTASSRAFHQPLAVHRCY